MNILVICQYYYPEPFRITDICESLVKRGHKVTVVTGVPNYPEGEIYSGYENNAHSSEVINGVEVHRCPIIPRKKGVFYRFLNYFSYPYKASAFLNNHKLFSYTDYDVIFVNQLSPVMMAEPAIKLKKKHNIPIVLYCLDIWPESLIAGGIKRNSIVYNLFFYISKKIYRSVDKILITSKSFREYLINQFDISTKDIVYLPQYAESIFSYLPFKETDDTVDLLFAGNIGDIQSVETIILAAKQLKDKKIIFHIVGNGSDLERLRKLAEGLNNVIFYGRRPVEDMPEFYDLADAVLVTLKSDPFLSLTLPGKVQSYMAAGKPIIGAIDGETNNVILEANCGFCGPAENVEELVKNIIRFIDSTKKSEMSKNARKYYEEHFEQTVFIDKLELELNS